MCRCACAHTTVHECTQKEVLQERRFMLRASAQPSSSVAGWHWQGTTCFIHSLLLFSTSLQGNAIIGTTKEKKCHRAAFQEHNSPQGIDKSKTKQVGGAERLASKKKRKGSRGRENCWVPLTVALCPGRSCPPQKGQILGKPISPLEKIRLSTGEMLQDLTR